MKAAFSLFGLLVIANTMAFADAERGLEVAMSVDAADRGWGDEEVSAEMILRAVDGREVKRFIRTRSIEVDGDGDKTLVVFDRPADVKGTVFLTHAHKMGNDDQWLFLPALRRVKRISSSNRSGPFMGSEFAFEDIASEEVERYAYSFIEDGECIDGLDCYIYERYPVDESSGYSKQIVYADKEHHRIHKIEYYDRKNSHLKTLERSEYERFGEFWRARRWEMTNHQKGKSTTVLWIDREFDLGFDESDFTKNAMQRFR